jgi:hypothetical protein
VASREPILTFLSGTGDAVGILFRISGARELHQGSPLRLMPRVMGVRMVFVERHQFDIAGPTGWLVNDFQFDMRNAASDHPQLLGSRIRNINNSAASERPTVVDPDRDGISREEVGHAHSCAERQRGMCGRQIPQIGIFAARGP